MPKVIETLIVYIGIWVICIHFQTGYIHLKSDAWIMIYGVCTALLAASLSEWYSGSPKGPLEKMSKNQVIKEYRKLVALNRDVLDQNAELITALRRITEQSNGKSE